MVDAQAESQRLSTEKTMVADRRRWQMNVFLLCFFL
jgi:hypothetical protein